MRVATYKPRKRGARNLKVLHDRMARGVLLSIIVTLLFVCVVPIARAQIGLVRIYNDSPFRVMVLSQRIDYYGYRSWRPIGDIPPKAYREFPNVPAGVMLGARAVGARREWRPFMVVYPYGRPFFQYTLRN